MGSGMVVLVVGIIAVLAVIDVVEWRQHRSVGGRRRHESTFKGADGDPWG